MVGREKDMEVIRAGERDQASLRDQIEKLRRDLYSSSQQVTASHSLQFLRIQKVTVLQFTKTLFDLILVCTLNVSICYLVCVICYLFMGEW
jgi:hypothetical protein